MPISSTSASNLNSITNLKTELYNKFETYDGNIQPLGWIDRDVEARQLLKSFFAALLELESSIQNYKTSWQTLETNINALLSLSNNTPNNLDIGDSADILAEKNSIFASLDNEIAILFNFLDTKFTNTPALGQSPGIRSTFENQAPLMQPIVELIIGFFANTAKLDVLITAHIKGVNLGTISSPFSGVSNETFANYPYNILQSVSNTSVSVNTIIAKCQSKDIKESVGSFMTTDLNNLADNIILVLGDLNIDSTISTFKTNVESLISTLQNLYDTNVR